MTLIYQFLDNPLFGVTLTVGTLILFQILFKKTKNPLLNPLIFAIVGIIAFLKITGIPYESYAKGGNIISFFLGPVTVALAVPLYKQFDKLKANAVPILISITTGVVVAIISTVLMGRAFGLSPEMIASLAPKATTTAIAMDLSATMGGDPALTVAFVVVAGTTGFIIGEQVLTLLKIKSKTAKGIGLGTSAHAFGTNRALLMGEEEGAMSSLAIGVAGIITTFLLPILIKILM